MMRQNRPATSRAASQHLLQSGASAHFAVRHRDLPACRIGWRNEPTRRRGDPMDSLEQRIDHVLSGQLAGVLATQQCNPPSPGQPYTSLMAFAHTPDLRFVVIATLKETQKHTNLLQNACLSLLIDNRGNSASDYEKAIAISVTGRAEAISDAERDGLCTLFLRKHPALQSFLSLPACTLLRIRVLRYSVVSQFQATEVLEVA
jgi:heme iron utilization protein